MFSKKETNLGSGSYGFPSLSFCKVDNPLSLPYIPN